MEPVPVPRLHMTVFSPTHCLHLSKYTSQARVKQELDEDTCGLSAMTRGLSPESKKLVSGLNDTPQSRQLVAKLLQAKQMQGDMLRFLIANMYITKRCLVCFFLIAIFMLLLQHACHHHAVMQQLSIQGDPPMPSTKAEFRDTPTGVSRAAMHKIKDEAKLQHMHNMSDGQRELMARAGTLYSEEQQRALQQQQALDAAREVAAQQAAAVATLQRQHRQHAEKEAAKLQQEAEETKAAAFVQMQQLAAQRQQQEEEHREAERKAAEQLAVLQQEAAARTQQRASLQEALYVQELQVQQKTEEQMYWQQQQQHWQDTLVDHEPPARAPRKPAATPPTVRQSPVPTPEFNRDLACTAMAADFANAYLSMEGQQNVAAAAHRAAPARPAAAYQYTAPRTAMPEVAATPIRDSAWETHVADQAYKRRMEEEQEDVRMVSPAKVEQELRMTTAQLAGHGQAEEQDVDWAAKAQKLEALLKQCQSKAAEQETTTPRAKAYGPTPATSALPKRNLASHFLRVASQIQTDAAEQDYDADKEDGGSHWWTNTGHKRKFSYDDEWPAPPKAMPRTGQSAFAAAGLPVPPPPLTQEEFDQKMQEIAASIPAPPAPPKAAKSGMPSAPKGLTTKAMPIPPPDSAGFPCRSKPAAARMNPAPEATSNPGPEANSNPPQVGTNSAPEASRNPAPGATSNPEPEATSNPEPEATRNQAPEANRNPPEVSTNSAPEAPKGRREST